MKFTWKIIAVTVTVVALALGTGSYFMLSSSLQSRFNAEVENAQTETELLCLTLQAVTSSLLVFDGGLTAEEAVTQVLEDESMFDSYDFTVDTEPVDAADSDSIVTTVISSEDTYTLRSVEVITISGTALYVSCYRDISDIFLQIQENVHSYQLITVIVLICATIIIAVSALFMTKPIRNLSLASRELAGGNYGSRAAVNSSDELGQLAGDFNLMADTLEAKIKELADNVQRQKRFTASFAHELKTPLTSVIGYADTLRRRSLDPEKQFEAANYIFAEGKRLEDISFALMNLFEIEKNKPVMKSVNASVLAASTAESCRHSLKQKDLRFIVNVESADVSSEPNLIISLLRNLIDNARKASVAGGEIQLSGKKVPNGYRFTVTDKGNGIPAEALAHITEAFYMVDKSRARAEGGAGLGLTLCQKIVETHGTTLKFESIEGIGTSVSFELKGGEQK